jgi:hypothetical protein
MGLFKKIKKVVKKTVKAPLKVHKKVLKTSAKHTRKAVKRGVKQTKRTVRAGNKIRKASNRVATGRKATKKPTSGVARKGHGSRTGTVSRSGLASRVKAGQGRMKAMPVKPGAGVSRKPSTPARRKSAVRKGPSRAGGSRR